MTDSIFQAIVLGLVQGLAEFLPISSSAHLALTPYLLGWPDPGLAFDVALHVGTLAAVLWYFRRDWAELTVAGFRLLRTRRADTEGERRVIHLVIATIPGAVAGLLLNDLAEGVLRHPLLTAIALIAMGVILWASDRFAGRDRELSGMGWMDALLLGLAQVCALVPGVSRSGSTMTAGRLLGFDRRAAARFSFLMSMPITAAAALFKVPEVISEGGVNAPLVAGVIAAGLSSWLAIAVLLRFLAKHGFGVFALYRLVLGAVVLFTLASRG